MSEIAILMAAGMGIRMRPITDSTPKPLVKVKGIPMIETVINALNHRGVSHIYVVVGYLGEKFSYLRNKYNNVSIVENKDFRTVNNISSVYTVSDVLIKTETDVFICEADLYVSDNSIFDKALRKSGYYGKMVNGHSDDWVFKQDVNGRIIRVCKGGYNCFNMVGIAFFRNEDAKKLGMLIKESYGMDGYEDLFWDDVVDRNINQLDLVVYRVNNDQIKEIDTVEELSLIDQGYNSRGGNWKFESR